MDAEMTKWTYMEEIVEGANQMRSVCEREGEQGWELASVIPACRRMGLNDTFSLLFKKPVTEAKP